MSYFFTEEKCNGILTSTQFIQDHLFIENEVFVDSHKSPLNEFPEELGINDNRYYILLIVKYVFNYLILY